MSKPPKDSSIQKKKKVASAPKNILNYTVSEQPNKDNSLWLNWDVIGLSATAITLGGAAIFFVSGWFYEARWYSFYGINISQLDLSPINFMVQGIPGILFFFISFSISWVLIKISKGLFQTFWAHRIEGDTLGVQLTNLIIGSELVWVSTLSFLLLSTFAVVGELAFTMLFRKTYQTSYLTIAGGIASFLVVVFIWYGLRSLRSDLVLIKSALSIIEVYLYKKSSNIQSALNGIIGLLTIIAIALTFMISISISGIQGQFDAISHKRSLSGWFLPKTIVSSDKNLPILSEYLIDLSDEGLYKYGLFGLVAADDQKYYFVEYKEGRYLTHPMVYAINKQNVDISFVVTGETYLVDLDDIRNYFPTKTPTPTPTMTPTQQETPKQ